MTAPGGGTPGVPAGVPAGAPAAATPAKTTGGGCLKGCALGCGGLTVLLLALGVAGWFGWRHWGRPWLDRKEQAVARYVPKGILPGHGAGGLSGSQLAAALSPRLPASAGETGRRDLPHDLWVPAATGPAAYDTQDGGLATAVVRVKGASVPRLTATARKRMRARGWKLQYAGADGRGQRLDFSRRGAAATVRLFPRAGAVEVWVSRRATGAGSRSGSGATPGR